MKISVALTLSVVSWQVVTMVPALAQTPSSVDDLIRALKPNASKVTRGIRPIGPSESPSPTVAVRPVSQRTRTWTAPAAPVPAPATTELAAVSMLIEFESGSDRLTPSAMKELDKLGRALSASELSNYKFRIEGHTDAVGSRDLNQTLSERRAKTVVDYITTRYGVDSARLTAVGMGFSQMAVPTADGVAEPRNRRVQIVNMGA